MNLFEQKDDMEIIGSIEQTKIQSRWKHMEKIIDHIFISDNNEQQTNLIEKYYINEEDIRKSLIISIELETHKYKLDYRIKYDERIEYIAYLYKQMFLTNAIIIDNDDLYDSVDKYAQLLDKIVGIEYELKNEKITKLLKNFLKQCAYNYFSNNQDKINEVILLIRNNIHKLNILNILKFISEHSNRLSKKNFIKILDKMRT